MEYGSEEKEISSNSNGNTQLGNDNPVIQNPSFNKGNTNMSMSSLSALLLQPNLIANQNAVPEMENISKEVMERVKSLRQNTATEQQKATLPKSVSTLTAAMSPNLPGLVFNTIIGDVVLAMPVLFFKDGITDATETIQIGQDAPRGYAKVPNSFMTVELQKKIKDTFSHIDGKKMSDVILINPRVINLERWIKNGKTGEDMHRDVASELLVNWNEGLMFVVQMLEVKTNQSLPSPFQNGKHLYGQHQTAIARVEATSAQEGMSIKPYTNLSVKMVTSNKNGQNYGNNQQSQSIINANLNVQLDVMSMQQFQMGRAQRPNQPGVGPLFPVISIGTSQPGETMGHNKSIMSIMMGVYAALAANKQDVLSEAIRTKQVGHRGNLSVFNTLLSTYLPGAYTAQNFLTDKNIMNIGVVTQWLATYMSTNAVFVIDTPAFLDNSSEAEFWNGIANKDNQSTFAKAAIAAVDVMSNGKFSKLAAENAQLHQGRDVTKQWVPGGSILRQTRTLRPYGIGQAKDGTWFDLSEIDQMFLRQDAYYGQQENAILEYTGLVAGTIGNDTRVRQYNITNRLQALLNNTARIDGWAVRYVLDSAFVATMAQAMIEAGTLTVSASQYAGQWTQQFDNDLLGMVMTAALAPSAVQPMGLSPLFVNNY